MPAADKKISDLPSITTAGPGFYVVVVDPSLGTGGSGKMTANDFAYIISRLTTNHGLSFAGSTAPSLSAGSSNIIYYDTASQATMISENGAAFRAVVLVGKAATLPNLTLTSPTINTPTITVPVITDLSSMQHDHHNAATGGLVIDVPVPLTDAATIVTDASAGSYFRVTLGGNRTLGAPANPHDGQVAVWEFIQDSGSPRSITLSSAAGGFVFGTDITAVTLTNGNGKRDYMTAIYNSTANKWAVTGLVRGY